ncbi:MAG: mechanosensitive ion channel family protein [Actinomycetota bacterium]
MFPLTPDDSDSGGEGTFDNVSFDDCGENPSWLCEQIYDLTGGNGFLASTADALLTILIILIIAWIVVRVIKRYLRKAIQKMIASEPSSSTRVGLKRLGLDDSGDEDLLGSSPDATSRRAARATSISFVLGGTVSVIVWTLAVLMALAELGLNLGPLIAGAGIAGVAVGFGAQDLVKDCISGLFVLLEDQYGIGDVVDLGEAIGVVERISLRVTILRGLDGTVWHVPNGEVARVGNLSQLWSVAVVDLDVAYHSDLDRVGEIMLNAAREVCDTEEWAPIVIEEPNLLGVEALGADGITLRITVKTKPGEQWALQRELRRHFKQVFDDAGIEIPFPQRTIWMRSGDE